MAAKQRLFRAIVASTGFAAGSAWALSPTFAKVSNNTPVSESTGTQDPPAHEDFINGMSKLHVMAETSQTRSLQTILRNQDTTRQDFVFFADRLMRLLVEEALSFVPFKRSVVSTPTGETYDGLQFTAKICGVSIMRAGESMEAAFRATCRDIRIGKILVQRNEETGLPDERYSYAKFPADIKDRWVFLLDPMLATGGSAIRAVNILKDAGVSEDKIIFVNLLCCPEGLVAFNKAFPSVQIVTAAVDPVLNHQKYILPGLGDFGDRYFGTAGW
eukprot:Rhum_TRINITY_DN15585_c0_g1::Rhum_TRINITY_DN15585_c0_g1_i1::g.161341::m.161341/K00761/upp, UPRT; uracil phosphoribosyltransferase